MIAHFSFAKTLATATAGLALAFLMYYLTLLSDPNPLLYVESRSQWAVVIVVVWVVGVPWTAIMFKLLYQLFFCRRVSLWMSDGHIVYLSRLFMNVSAGDVKRANIKTTRGYGITNRSIRLELRSGKVRSIPVNLIAEPLPSVLSRIEEMCRIAPSADS